MAIIKSFKADVSSNSPSSEQRVNAQNISCETSYSGPFMLSTQLIELNYSALCLLSYVIVEFNDWRCYKYNYMYLCRHEGLRVWGGGIVKYR